eukprot:1831713-Rhodomonas_salina.1
MLLGVCFGACALGVCEYLEEAESLDFECAVEVIDGASQHHHPDPAGAHTDLDACVHGYADGDRDEMIRER